MNVAFLLFNQFVFICCDKSYFMNVGDEWSQQGEFLRQED